MSGSATHYLYVIAVDGRESECVKLGFADDPERRLRELQCGTPDRLVLHHAEPVAANQVRRFERALHRDMHHRRQRGEWFDLCVDEARKHVVFTVMRYEPEFAAADLRRADPEPL